MIKELFFDTDCISSFLWAKQENLLLQLYPGRIILPYEVFIELSNPSIPHIKSKISDLCSKGDVSTMKIVMITEECRLFYEMAISPPKGETVIGKGEAAALALAKVHNGIVASNNMKDIKRYIEKLKLNHITTGDILVEAMNKWLIDENIGNQIWANMLSKQRLLPAATFSDYLKLR
ncbi:MAG: hypothetical protein QME06_09905 [Desulfobacterales bacterium]|nr:hypothetical protein [Desulfobacterales bacterium]